MNSLIKKIELIANLAIIVVAVLVGVVVLRNYVLPRPPTSQPASPAIQPGTRLSIPGVHWNANGRTLLLALSTECHFCTKSAPFYVRVAQQRARFSNLKLVAVFPQTAQEGQKYLHDLGVQVDEVRESQLETLGVRGTPTLILTNEQGVVQDSWRGKLTSEKETEVLSRLK